MSTVPSTPLYLDWTFWSFFVAGVALVLSQVPPVRLWFKSAKLDFEIYSRLVLMHKVGNPNIQTHFLITNIGGRKVRIKHIRIEIKLKDKLVASVPAQNYLQNQSDKDSILFTAFKLSPGDEWAHITNLLNFFEIDDEREYQDIQSKMITDYRKRTEELKKEKGVKEIEEDIELDTRLVERVQTMFDNKFVWNPGEYTMTVNIFTDIERANVKKIYRFVIFESQTEALKEIKNHFKFGAGVWWEAPNVSSTLSVPIHEMKGN